MTTSLDPQGPQAKTPGAAVFRRGGAPTQLSQTDAPRFVVAILIALPLIFNAIALAPEVQHSTPSANDQVFHCLLIERANQAVSAGDNPFDHWVPELELGFPEFFYYQHLPHLLIVGLYRLLLKQVSLIRLLNLVRFLLMVTFPLTVYWSMRRMEFSRIAAATASLLSPMLSSRFDYGFDFHSYIWGGFGMFPQLCAMHLIFVASACVWYTIKHSRGLSAAILASSALVLSDLFYGYMFGIIVAILWLLSLLEEFTRVADPIAIGVKIGRSTLRLAIVAVGAGLITAYQVVPFFARIQYLNLALPPRLDDANSHIALYQLRWLSAQIHSLDLMLPLTFKQLKIFFGGHFFDNNRLPLVTCLVVVGIIYGIVTHREQARVALMLLAAWMVLLVPNALRTQLIPLMPFLRLVPFFRFVSGVDLGAILVAGLGGECIWRLCRPHSSRAVMFGLIVLLTAFYSPLVAERWNFYQEHAEGMELTDRALHDDQDLPVVESWLHHAPPGRVYAGTRGNWGTWMHMGSVHLYDLLPIEQFATVMPWQTLSLNAPLLWQLAIPSAEICHLFNIRYVIAPPQMTLGDFYRRVLATTRYNLYEVDSGGYMQLGRIVGIHPMESSEALFRFNQKWMGSSDPEQGRFIAFPSPDGSSQPDLSKLLDPSFHSEGSSQLGSIADDAVTPDSFSADVTASSSAVLVLKVTYHPNWHVTVDGREQPTFMVSPSFIGTAIVPGRHKVVAEYRSNTLKKWLLVLAGLCLLATLAGCIYEHRSGFELKDRRRADDVTNR